VETDDTEVIADPESSDAGLRGLLGDRNEHSAEAERQLHPSESLPCLGGVTRPGSVDGIGT